MQYQLISISQKDPRRQKSFMQYQMQYAISSFVEVLAQGDVSVKRRQLTFVNCKSNDIALMVTGIWGLGSCCKIQVNCDVALMISSWGLVSCFKLQVN
jgi:hypothetical protein